MYHRYSQITMYSRFVLLIDSITLGWGPPPKRGRGAAPAGKFAFKAGELPNCVGHRYQSSTWIHGQVLCPDPLVAAILGNQGQSVRDSAR